jgi:hypothetical protein
MRDQGNQSIKRICMKPLTIILSVVSILTASTAISAAQLEMKALVQDFLGQNYPSMIQSPVNSGILYDLVAPISGMPAFDGCNDSIVVTVEQWLQMSHELRGASLIPSSLPSDQELRNIGNRNARNRIYPIAFLDYRYQSIRPGAKVEEAVIFEGNRIVSIDETAMEERRVFTGSVLRDWSYRGTDVQFRIDEQDLYFTNEQATLKSLEVDFDDGDGFRAAQGDIHISYRDIGTKTIRVRAIRENGEILRNAFRFEVRSLDTPDPTETWQVEATIPYNGNFNSGEVYVYLSDQHTTLTNPIILAEGIDLDESRNWDELYEMLNQENLLEDVRELGFDAVILNHDNGTDYIQGNAYLLVELINQVNAIIPDAATITLVGTSMGGLTSRYALTYMETNDLPHNVGLWISFDGPHRGANIPLGIQYWMDFFAGQASEAGQYRDALNSPAARQLLVAHFTNPPSSNVSADPLRTSFISDLTQIGDFPTEPRTVALANGSGAMTGLDFNPGDQLIRWEYSSFLVDITGNSWSLNDWQTNVIFRGEINQIWPLPDESRTVAVNPAWPWDNAPGGKTNSMQTMGDVNPGYGDIVALHNHHCFIPTTSALGLAVADPFYNIAGSTQLYNLTPFDTLYFPTWNQSHSVVVPENYDWFMSELLNTIPIPSLSINPAALDFSPTSTGDSRDLSISTLNERTWNTTIEGMELQAGDAFSLITVPNLPLTLASEEDRSFTLRFSPEEPQLYRDTLTISYEQRTIRVPLTGLGIEGNLELSAEMIDFSLVHVNSTEEREFDIINSGSAPLIVTDVAVFDTAFQVRLSDTASPRNAEPIIKRRNQSTLDDITFTLNPGSSQHVIVSFSPDEETEYEAWVLITSTGTIAEMHLLGQGGVQHITVNPDSLSFGELVVGDQMTLPFAVSNPGLWDLKISDMTVNLNGIFGLSPTPLWPDTIATQSVYEYRILFSPADTGFFQDVLTIYHDAGNPIELDLSGRAVQAIMVLRPDTVNFAGTWTDSISMEELWIFNEGSAILSIEDISILGEGFRISEDLESISPGDSASVAVTFVPEDTLNYSATIRFASNIGERTATAGGYGIWTTLTAEPEQVLIEAAFPDSVFTQTVVVRSIGNTAIEGIIASLSVGATFWIETAPADRIPAYGTDSLVIAFSSSINGVFLDTLLIGEDRGGLLRIPLSTDVASGLTEAGSTIPGQYFLSQNYPNPFNPTTEISYDIPIAGYVSLRVYDVLGREISVLMNGYSEAGTHRASFNGDELGSGVYFARLDAGGYAQTRKLMLLK